MNFVNCPPALFNSTEKCEAVKKFILTQDKCGEKFGDTYVIDGTFWFPFLLSADATIKL